MRIGLLRYIPHHEHTRDIPSDCNFKNKFHAGRAGSIRGVVTQPKTSNKMHVRTHISSAGVKNSMVLSFTGVMNSMVLSLIYSSLIKLGPAYSTLVSPTGRHTHRAVTSEMKPVL